MSLAGKTIKSSTTGTKGVIKGADKKNLIVSFTYFGDIVVPLRRYNELLVVSEEVKEEIEEYIASLNKTKKKTEETE